LSKALFIRRVKMFRETILEEMKRENQCFEYTDHEIEHTLKVLKFAEEIMDGEGVSGSERELISITAILHDIGIKEAILKYNSAAAPYQEKEGEIKARVILERVGYPKSLTDRVCYIVGNHHTESKIDGFDFLIQWEADLLVNLESMEVKNDRQKLKETIDDNFKTETGRKIAYSIYMK
jgi:HD superfamily phosphodiesterase